MKLTKRTEICIVTVSATVLKNNSYSCCSKMKATSNEKKSYTKQVRASSAKQKLVKTGSVTITADHFCLCSTNGIDQEREKKECLGNNIGRKHCLAVVDTAALSICAS